jgi:hypothetical protein
MAITRPITAADQAYVGDDTEIRLVVYEDSGQTIVLDVADADLAFILSLQSNDVTPLIEKATGGSPGGGITVEGVYNSDPLLNTQEVVIALAAEDSYADTVQLKKRKYYYALKRTDDGQRSTLMHGAFQFLRVPTAAK